MDAIYIPYLFKAHQRSQEFQFEEFLPELETLTPVRGHLKVTHKTTYIEVTAQAETIVTLICHRCLKQYNHRLKVDTSEMIWLDATAHQNHLDSLDVEINVEDLVETLSPQGYFEPDDWLYQQLCLETPLRQLCDGPCEPPQTPAHSANNPIDSRWAALEALKRQLG
ncbi:MAG: YceD family protein [Cyanobacteria bacterium J06592_8]